MVSNGAKQTLYTLFQVLLDTGDKVILPAPYWLSYPPWFTWPGGRSVIVPTRQDENHQLDVSFGAVALDLAERTFVVKGFSKNWAMTGWRLGYLAGPESSWAKPWRSRAKAPATCAALCNMGAWRC
ncbi:Aspartate aminotransferase (EC 2.6.1.1) [Candidatus Synechococcus spongiarum]|uniref:Aminotransferase n=2 Tax=Candidatus Synechococcus spongiarum TaxID=431041 RepID=A0A161KBD0_9SYNE|nr:Aspartate aminotransferase (EC 2.6.1.1) [Candidatus Synechococcus spongiarum]